MSSKKQSQDIVPTLNAFIRGTLPKGEVSEKILRPGISSSRREGSRLTLSSPACSRDPTTMAWKLYVGAGQPSSSGQQQHRTAMRRSHVQASRCITWGTGMCMRHQA